MEENRLRNYIELQLSQLIISGNVLFAHLLSQSPSLITWGRTFFASLVLGGFLLLRKRPLLFPHKKENFWSLCSGLLLALHWVTFFASAQVSSVAIAVVTLFTHPVWTVLLEPFHFKTRIKPLDVVMSLVVLFAMWILVPEFQLSNKYALGVLLGLTSAFALAFRNLWTKIHLSSHPSSTVLFHQTVVCCVILTPSIFLEPIFKTEKEWFLVILLGVFFTAFAHTLYIRAVFYMKVKTVALMTTVQPVYSSLLAWLLLKEIPRGQDLIGGVLILTAALVETIRYQRRKE
ncbi:permease [Leptospira perolatii]|uniref:Permease n=1 Tax=Leptospira perolatii TaxID=2023191 RepID=A0A2M9ZQJ2_9LEPT|nr:DMT family transporter [Leptospira perolatii]PJZ70521.1 permease [Leptospira perolatii]PJZ74357.1 permease [Leptospira perolatii]